FIGARIDTNGAAAATVVFNPLSWERTDVVEAEVALGGGGREIEVRDGEGNLALSELLGRDGASGRAKLRFVAEHVPSLGYKVFHVVTVPKARHAESGLSVHGTTLENELVRVTVDGTSGCITSLFDKRSNKEVIAAGGCANRLQAFADQPK